MVEFVTVEVALVEVVMVEPEKDGAEMTEAKMVEMTMVEDEMVEFTMVEVTMVEDALVEVVMIEVAMAGVVTMFGVAKIELQWLNLPRLRSSVGGKCCEPNSDSWNPYVPPPSHGLSLRNILAQCFVRYNMVGTLL